MKLSPLLMLLMLTLFLLARSATAQPADTGGQRVFDCLEPGKFVTHKQRIPIRIVLVGFEAGVVNLSDLEAVLPGTYEPRVRMPTFFGLKGRDLGLEYEFDYQIVRKGRSFSDGLFDHLTRIGTEGPLTLYQERYNDQEKNVLDVTGPVLYIDAPRVERWLTRHDDADRPGYTVYFINWYGRADFRFHVYTRAGEPDPDTDTDFGLMLWNAISSWGGTSSRSWFYDFSAGPEWNMSNWIVDRENIGGGPQDEYRMPVIWEYATGGYRSPEVLGHDMGLLTRYVAINLLFTTSPLYDPLVTAPGPHGSKVADVSMLEDNSASSGLDFLDPAFARNRLRRFQPYYRWETGLRDFDPIDAGAKRALDIFTFNILGLDCWLQYRSRAAQLFCYFDQNLGLYVPPYGDRDYVGEIFVFNTTDEGMGRLPGFLGLSDHNWVDGTQSFNYLFGTDSSQDLGFGFTALALHEFGHHIGLSHPHDGYDFETGVDYVPEGQFYFAWEGGESDTVMHYLKLSNGFGRYERDNMYRWELAGYLNRANALAGDILDSPHSRLVRDALQKADRHAAQAKEKFLAWRYLQGVRKARKAYTILVEAAEEAGVATTSLDSARKRLPGKPPPMKGCRPRLLEELLKGG